MIDKRFIEIGKRLLAETEIESVLDAALDSAIEVSGAERGLIIVFKNEHHLDFESARNLDKTTLENPDFEISNTLINQVRKTGEPVCSRNALADSKFKSKSVQRLKILSVICVPLQVEEHLFGVLYLDNRKVRGVFQGDICTLFLHPFAEFISLAVYKALERRRLSHQISELEKELRGKYLFDSIIGSDEAMVQVLKLVAQVADTDVAALIVGESGTGKELIARALHYNSRRKTKPFVAINCAALPENLLESELFGHVRGAFTGAVAEKKGWFETADGGSIFLDEVSELPPHLQVKLLRVLQTGEYSRVGQAEMRRCNVRIISAASRDLHQLVQENQFREEFYYRLNVVEIKLPPLRRRKTDIPLLARHFLQMYCEKYQKPGIRISAAAEHCLLQYNFPGNIRELENIMQRAIVLCQGDTILPKHLPENLSGAPCLDAEQRELCFKDAKQLAVARFEKEYLSHCLQQSRGNISQAARLAGMDVKNFYTKIKNHDIRPERFKY